MKYYAIIGQSGCTYDETSNPAAPEGYIEMQWPPTDAGQVAQADGTWRSYEATPAEIAIARMAEIDTQIQLLEQKAIRPMLAITMGEDVAEPYDYERRAELVNQIIDLRCERQMLDFLELTE